VIVLSNHLLLTCIRTNGILTMVEDTCMGQQEVNETGIFVQLEGVFALIGQKSTNIDGKILLVW